MFSIICVGFVIFIVLSFSFFLLTMFGNFLLSDKNAGFVLPLMIHSIILAVLITKHLIERGFV